MSTTMILNRIKQISSDIAKLEKELGVEYTKESSKLKEIQRIRNSIPKNASASTLSSKNRQIDSCNSAIAESKKKQGALMTKKAKKQSELNTAQQQLTKEQTAEQSKLLKLQERAISKQQASIDNLHNSVLVTPNALGDHITSPVITVCKEYDFFISHAFEDKAEIAEPLANALIEKGASVWLDKFVLRVGDSLRESIDQGLIHSKYGIVILTKTYMQKFWTGKELNGLFAKWSSGDDKVILPVWHNISKDDVASFSLVLADMIALKTADFTIVEMADEFIQLIEE